MRSALTCRLRWKLIRANQQVENTVRAMHAHQRERRHAQAQKSVAAMEKEEESKKAAALEECREKERELSRRARDAKLGRQEATALQTELEQGVSKGCNGSGPRPLEPNLIRSPLI
jgi:hypothetical protein